MRKGFSILEVILAVAVFIIFATGAVIALIQGYNTNRLGAEFSIASQFASEGIEAVRSIKNQAYINIVNTASTGVARNASNIWAFSGTNNIFSVGKNYTRTIAIEDVRRDATPPLGNIISSGGTVDNDSKKITSTVTWNFGSARSESVSFTTYLSDWRKALNTIGDALALYGDITSVAQPKYRTYTNSTDTFSSESTTGSSFTDSAVGESFKVKTSPTKVEAVAGYVNNSGDLRILCFNGSSWSTEFSVTVGGTGTNDQRFGIAYETNSGDVLVVYSTNTSPTNEMAYRTKPGSADCGSANWSAETPIDATRTSGVVHWIRMEGNPLSSSNNIALAWADSNSDLSAMQWTGTSWGIGEPSSALEANLERVSVSQDVQSFDIAYEAQTGNLMVVWGLSQATGCTAGTTIATTNCIRYARYTTSWQAVAVIPTVADPATNIDISANSNSNEIVLAALDNSQADLSVAYWSGTTWTGRANVDTSTTAAAAGTKLVATGWLTSGATTRYVVLYDDSNAANISWLVGNGSGAPAAQTDFSPTPAFGRPHGWYDIQMDPKNKDRLLFNVSDNNSDYFAKRLVMTSTPAFSWSNSDGSAALEANLGQINTAPFAVSYWRNP
jgi:type II secretory pathway pseudopilin PulG